MGNPNHHKSLIDRGNGRGHLGEEITLQVKMASDGYLHCAVVDVAIA